MRKWSVFALLLSGPLVLVAQTSEITGQVVDPTGARVPGAATVVTNMGTGIKSHTTTNEEGYYTVPALNPGNYEVAVTMLGFKAATRSAVKLDVGQIARIDFRLVLGSPTEQLNITSAAPLVQSESSSVGQVIAQASVVDLPLNGRNFTQLSALTPGASAAPSSGMFGASGVTASGMRNSNTVFLMNGINVTEQDSNGTNILPPPDAIQEFKVQTNNLDAASGLGGTVISVELKGGTNALHGSLYEFLRNDALDARNFFSTSVPKLKQNQFGFTLGGPIKKDKTFVFADYQGLRVGAGQTFNVVVPTAAMRAGDFSGSTPIQDPTTGKPFPNNLIPAGRISPQAAFFLKFFQLPNRPQGTFGRDANSQNDSNQFDIRIDHQLREADSLKFTYSFIQPNSFVPGAFPDNGAVTSAMRNQAAGISEVHTFSPHVLNQFTLGYTRVRYFGAQQGLGNNYTVQSGIGGFDQTSTAYPGFPGLTVSGFQGLTDNAFQPLRFRENNYNLRDLATVVRGRHLIQAGVEYTRHSNFTTNSARNRGEFTFNGTYTGNAWGDYLLGLPYQGARTFPRDLFGYYNNYIEPFIQDSWKLTPRLTLNLGLRYSLFPQPTAMHNVLSSVDPVANQIVVASDSQGRIQMGAQQVAQYVFPLFAGIIVPSSKIGLDSSLRYPNHTNFAPRLGVAWQAGAGFVVRAGYSILYSPYQGNQYEGTVAGANLPFFADQLAIFNTTPIPTKTLADFFPPVSLGAFILPPLTFFQIDPHSPVPYFQQWNFALQKVIGGVVSAEGAYVGSKSTHLSFSLPVNVPAPGPGNIQARRQNPTFSSGGLMQGTDSSTYNAFQGKLETRSWRGLNVLATLTWSKALDYQASDAQTSPVQDPNNIKAEHAPYGPAARFTLGAVYELPFLKKRPNFLSQILGGWALSSILTGQSGSPFTPTINTDPANTGTSRRPNRIGEGSLPNPTIDRWFDVSAFTVPAPFTYGNSGINILDGPTRTNWDFGLFKNFPFRLFSEAGNIQFRAEFFNFTNTAHFGLPTTSIQSSSAGKILSADTPRQIQFALKFAF
jgi:hypothetical protein